MPVRLGYLLVIVIVGCRGAVDQDMDGFAAAGITIKQNSAGEIYWVDTAGADLPNHFWKNLIDFEHIEQLALTGSLVTDADLPQLTSLHTLRSLDLSYTRITSSGLSVLSRMEDLQTLSLNGVSLDEMAIEPLGQLTRLQSLSLMDCGLSAEETVKVQNALPACLVVR
jgi:hypothetical protein